MKQVLSSRVLYDQFRVQMRKIADVKNALAVLQWDQETYLPPKGSFFRGQQIATLSETAHLLFTEERTGDLLTELSARADLDEPEKKNIALTQQDYTRQKKYSAAFVRLMSETISRSYHAWIRSRKENSFSYFEKDLQDLVQLKKQETDILGFTAHPYDALLDEFEKGSTVSLLDKTFAGVRTPLKDLLDRILSKDSGDDSFLRLAYPRQAQWDFGISLIKQLGFDMEAGRQDISEHPFTTSFNVRDVRITTRINENDFSNMTWSCIHETGHALYEQGLPEGEYGMPAGEYASLGIHESQSRLWENNVGRSLGFWKFQYPRLQAVFPLQLGAVPLEQFYKAINKVKTSFIRTESDELTYHFHVMIRYELEKSLIEGSLSTRDIPAYWKEKYHSYLGLVVKDDKNGCLQDVHWSHGSFGYFPTYSLGSFYAAQFFATAQKQVQGLSASIENGQLEPLHIWLKQRIYQYGRMFTSEELCQKASGEVLNIGYFLQYLLDKYQKIYQF
jgi:carboxypeptidase Taq